MDKKASQQPPQLEAEIDIHTANTQYSNINLKFFQDNTTKFTIELGAPCDPTQESSGSLNYFRPPQTLNCPCIGIPNKLRVACPEFCINKLKSHKR